VPTAWILSTVSLLAITVGTLLIWLYLWMGRRVGEGGQSLESQRDYARHRRLLLVSVGLLAAWLLVQYLAAILV